MVQPTDPTWGLPACFVSLAGSVVWLLKALRQVAARVELCAEVCIPTQFRLVPFLDKRQPRTRVHSQLMPREGRAEPENLEWIVCLPGFPTQ